MLATLQHYCTWTNLLTAWGALWAVCSVTQNVGAPGSAYWKFCHAVLAMSPLDFVKTVKTLGAALVPPAATLLVCFALVVSACGGQAAENTGVANAAIFSSQLTMCVQGAATKAAADACRSNVEHVWCGDGGALAGYSACGAAPKDGGGQ